MIQALASVVETATGFVSSYAIKILGGLLLITILGFGIYYEVASHKIDSQLTQITTLKLDNTAKAALIAQRDKDLQDVQSLNTSLIVKERKNTQQLLKLQKRLKELSAVADSDPVAYGVQVNAIAKDRRRCIELATGAKRGKEDANNSLCDQL